MRVTMKPAMLGPKPPININRRKIGAISVGFVPIGNDASITAIKAHVQMKAIDKNIAIGCCFVKSVIFIFQTPKTILFAKLLHKSFLSEFYVIYALEFFFSVSLIDYYI